MISLRNTIAAATVVAALGSAAPASAATYSFDFLDYVMGTSGVTKTLFESGSLNAILVGAGIPINPSGSSSVALSDVFQSTGAFVADWSAQLNVRATAAVGGTTFTLLGETLTKAGSGVQIGFNYESAGPTPTTFAAVPGPLAGAGLPVVLGMMGFAAWRRRKAA